MSEGGGSEVPERLKGAWEEIQRVKALAAESKKGRVLSQEDLIARLTWAESMIQEAGHHLLETIRMVDHD